VFCLLDEEGGYGGNLYSGHRPNIKLEPSVISEARRLPQPARDCGRNS